MKNKPEVQKSADLDYPPQETCKMNLDWTDAMGSIKAMKRGSPNPNLFPLEIACPRTTTMLCLLHLHLVSFSTTEVGSFQRLE